MADLVGTDIPTGDEVKWYYAGGAATHIVNREYTLNGASMTKGKVMLGNTAEFGLVWGECTRSSTTFAVPIVEYNGASSGYATNTTNTNGFKIPTQCTSSDIISIKYINVGTTALVHLASCRDVKLSRAIDSKTISVQGPADAYPSRNTGLPTFRSSALVVAQLAHRFRLRVHRPSMSVLQTEAVDPPVKVHAPNTPAV